MAQARAITGLDRQASPTLNARVIVRARLADLYAYVDSVVDPANVQALHDMRIAAKRLRYTLEMFAPHLPATSQAAVEELVALQDELGTLHDSEVLLTLLQFSLGDGDSARRELTSQERFLLNQDMLACVLDRTDEPGPSEKERQGLERLIHRQELRREQSYAAFRQHWDRLEQRGFRKEIEALLGEGEQGLL